MPLNFVSALLAAAAVAQTGQPAAESAPVTIAVPPFPTPRSGGTGSTEAAQTGYRIAELIASDLRSTRRFLPLSSQLAGPYPYPEFSGPNFRRWRGTGAAALVTGFVQPESDGRITVGCYLFDVATGRETVRRGFRVEADQWRAAAHRCADAVHNALAGTPGYFESRIAYVAESGPRDFVIKRLAVMDRDGSNHRYVTAGAVPALGPQLSPDGTRLVYTSYAARLPQVVLLDVDSGEERPLGPQNAMSFAPRFSPDGRQVVFSVADAGNTELVMADLNGGPPVQLTYAPGTDTSPSFSPDGRRIVFESDRSGTQQLYVMNADGTDQRRISFGGARYASPAWSPDGERIAYTRIFEGLLRIGVMNPDGGGERVLSDSGRDEGPSWSPSGQEIAFQRIDPATGRPALYSISLAGGAAARLPAPQDGSDPSWSAIRGAE